MFSLKRIATMTAKMGEAALLARSTTKSFLDYFGIGTEYLDIYTENGRVSFTSYTEKIMHGREILKHPLETSIALDTLDFEEFCAEEKMHLAISIKDFRAIVSHAETLQTNVQAYYSFPTRPIQLTYSENGVACELTLMTIGDYQGSSLTPAPISVRGSSAAPTASRPSRQAFIQPREDNINQVVNEQRKEIMPPPSQPASRSFRPESLSQRPPRPSPPPPKASLDPESLFLPAGDDDRQWDERNFEDEEDILGWDVSGNHVGRTLGYISIVALAYVSEAASEELDQRIAPTQRLAEIDTLFSQG
ncbi:MAG: hypothetical protein Q9178_002034 [Gyalolechia marmorata]